MISSVDNRFRDECHVEVAEYVVAADMEVESAIHCPWTYYLLAALSCSSCQRLDSCKSDSSANIRKIIPSAVVRVRRHTDW